MNNTTPILDFGKVPPQAIDFEEAVLGIILLNKEAIDEVIAVLHPEMFYKEANKKIYGCAVNLYKHEIPIDYLTISEELKNNNEFDSVGGPLYLAGLTSKIYSISQINYYALVVKEKYMRRELIRHSSEVLNKAFDESLDFTELIEYCESDLLKITGELYKNDPIQLGKLVDGVINKIQKIINHEIKLIGNPTGLVKLDRMTGGFKNGEYILIAARPSIGKSALALQIALNGADLKYPVGIFSCEMSGESLAQRTISGASGKTNIELLRGECNIEKLLSQTENLINLPVYIDDTSGISIVELRSKARKLVMKHDIKLLIVDYIQLMKGEGRSREEEVSNISRGLKSIAKDLNIPVIGLSQLNRKSEETASKRPQLSNLRESGTLEQDADIVIMLHRPAHYGFSEMETDEGTNVSSMGVMELIIAKNRNGVTGSIFLYHNESITRIYDNKEEIQNLPF